MLRGEPADMDLKAALKEVKEDEFSLRDALAMEPTAHATPDGAHSKPAPTGGSQVPLDDLLKTIRDGKVSDLVAKLNAGADMEAEDAVRVSCSFLLPVLSGLPFSRPHSPPYLFLNCQPL